MIGRMSGALRRLTWCRTISGCEPSNEKIFSPPRKKWKLGPAVTASNFDIKACNRQSIHNPACESSRKIIKPAYVNASISAKTLPLPIHGITPTHWDEILIPKSGAKLSHHPREPREPRCQVKCRIYGNALHLTGLGFNAYIAHIFESIFIKVLRSAKNTRQEPQHSTHNINERFLRRCAMLSYIINSKNSSMWVYTHTLHPIGRESRRSHRPCQSYLLIFVRSTRRNLGACAIHTCITHNPPSWIQATCKQEVPAREGKGPSFNSWNYGLSL